MPVLLALESMSAQRMFGVFDLCRVLASLRYRLATGFSV